MADYRVLVIGPRRGLIDVLRQRDIPFSVWQEKAVFVVAGIGGTGKFRAYGDVNAGDHYTG
jgi:hypothetical protein